MNLTARLSRHITQKNSPICVGLDPDLTKIPHHIPQNLDGVRYFLESIIESTGPYCIAFKPNISFFEALGIEGLSLLATLRDRCPRDILWIIDAKRGDIGNTSAMQARFIFDHLGADATTLHPYMGDDSVMPFLSYRDKLSFVLGITSNDGSKTFAKQPMADGMPLWVHVIRRCQAWNASGNVGVVVGGTNLELKGARDMAPELPFLIPGVGAQGADFTAVVQASKADKGAVSLINMSRSVLYADSSRDFAKGAASSIREYLGRGL